MVEAATMVHGAEWTAKELFVYPNEYIYWSVQIVMYPLMTGLVAGAFVLSSLYHVFGQKDLKELAKFALVFSFALLFAAPMPLLYHLQHPFRGIQVFFTPHFTSAISAFGIVFFSYFIIVACEIWFVYREFVINRLKELEGKEGLWNAVLRYGYNCFTLGSRDISEEALARDHKAVKILAGVGIPVACFLHGYAGFIFGSVKANALWMTPLMPVIFIMSAIVSGIALCLITYILVMEWKKLRARSARGAAGVSLEELRGAEFDVVKKTSRYLLGFMIAAITLELLDMVFRGYTAVKSWDILRSVIYGKDFVNIFILQYTLGNLVPFVMLLLPGLTVRRVAVATCLVIFGVFMMRWNVVIGGQAFSLTFAGYMHYHIPFWPHNLETFREGVMGALSIAVMPFVLFWLFDKWLPSLGTEPKASA